MPFPLIVDERDESGHTTKHRRYRPVPDVAFLSYNFPLFLVEFDNQQDKYRLLVQMACALRLALAFLKESGDNDPSFFLMGAFFTKDHKIFRYFFFVDENQKVCLFKHTSGSTLPHPLNFRPAITKKFIRCAKFVTL